MYGYIYLTENLVNGKKYIGQHKAAEFDTTYYGSGIILQKAIKKYGLNNFRTKILPEIDNVPTICETLEELNKSEKFYINYFQCCTSSEYYNIDSGGSVGEVATKLSHESYSKKAEKKFKKIINNINKEEFINYYYTHNTDKIRAYFNLSYGYYKKVVDYFNIKPKTQEQINAIIKNTFIEKYGVENIFQSDDCKNKIKAIKLEKYGDTNYSNREKYKNTCLEKFGSVSPFGNNDVQNKSKDTIIKKFGTEENYREYQRSKSNETLIKKHGSVHEAYIEAGKKYSDKAELKRKLGIKSEKQQNKVWINNGIERHLIKKDEILPIGYEYGKGKF